MIKFERYKIVTLNENHRIIHLFNVIEIFMKFKIFEYHQFQNFSNVIDLRKQVLLNAENISERNSLIWSSELAS